MAFPVDIRFINEAERKLGVKFPASFVVRMVRNNGGEVSTHGEGLHNKVLAAQYKMALPNEQVLVAELKRTKDMLKLKGAIPS